MDSKSFSAVTVFNIDNAGKLVDKYGGTKAQVICGYDPAGLSVRIVPGKQTKIRDLRISTNCKLRKFALCRIKRSF